MTNPIIDPFIDFDEYVNGEWKKHTIIPDDQTDWGTFNILHEANIKRVTDILNSFYSDKSNNGINRPTQGSFQPTQGCFQPISLLFNTLLKIDNAHTEILRNSLHKYLSFVDNIRTINDVGYVLGFLMMIDIKPFLIINANEDPKNTEMIRMAMHAPHISLPEKEYYSDPDLEHFINSFKDVTGDTMSYVYKDRITRDEIIKIANDTVVIEKLIAGMLKPIEERREIDKLYFKTSLDEFINIVSDQRLPVAESKSTEGSHWPIKHMWNSLFKMVMMELKSDQEIIIYDIEFFQKLSTMLESTNLDKIKNYIKYVVVRDLGSKINHQIDTRLFKFFGKILLGQITMSNRNKIIVQYLNDTILGEIIGREYVSRYFDDDSKIYINQMVESIKNQMAKTLKSLKWMSAPTKKSALLKLEKFKTKIGHPNEWADHSSLIILLQKYIIDDYLPAECLIDAICEIRMYSFRINVLNKLDKPRNDNKWCVNVHEVNAFYDLQRNEIVFPAGILQPPLFDKHKSLFENYGFIGTVIGHEIIHGYDDQGRKFDHNGNTTDWWIESDLQNYMVSTDKIVKQYRLYEINGRYINGLLTLGENIADIGGIHLAYNSVIDYCKHNNIQFSLKDERDFFTSYAQLWKIITRPEKLLMKILTDPHSPNKYRIYALRNFDAFYEAFQSLSDINLNKIESKVDSDVMYLSPEKRIVMW